MPRKERAPARLPNPDWSRLVQEEHGGAGVAVKEAEIDGYAQRRGQRLRGGRQRNASAARLAAEARAMGHAEITLRSMVLKEDGERGRRCAVGTRIKRCA